MNEEIVSIFKDFNVNNKIIPVEHIRYKGKDKTFITWVLLSERPFFNCDDNNLYSLVQIDINVYSESNYLNIIKEIKKIMKMNNWLWVEDSSEMYEDDTELYHKTITFEKERFIDNG